MEFTTRVHTGAFGSRIGYGSRGLSLGSCFAGNIAGKLRAAKFNVVSNPFGVLFNPVSVAAALRTLAERRRFGHCDLIRDGDLWSGFDFHGSFSSVYADEVLSMMNDAVESGAEALSAADYVIITFGTAWVYELDGGFYDKTGNYVINDGNPPGRVVANCHKFPAEAFNRRRLTVGEIVEVYDSLLGEGGALAGKNIIMTVSPVRHLKDGLPGNNVSKAALLLAVDELAAKYSDVSYFPAYEIVNDELRDYRFYAADMLHPSDVAVDYIWERFRESVLSPEAAETAVEVAKIAAAVAHRPLNPGSDAHQKFMASMLAKTKELRERCPEADFSEEIEYFSKR